MEGLNFENIEKKKYHYTYSDGKVLGCPKIFECDANDDIEAQEKFFVFIQESNIDVTESEIRRTSVIN